MNDARFWWKFSLIFSIVALMAGIISVSTELNAVGLFLILFNIGVITYDVYALGWIQKFKDWLYE